MKHNILAIDQATLSGFSIYTNGTISKGNTLNLKHIKERSKQIQCFYDTITKLIEQNNITEIAAEDIYEGYQTAFKSLGELRGILYLIATQKQIPITFVSTQDHKYFLTGNEYANKTETMNELKQLGYTFKDDNQADSISIMLYYLHKNHLPVTHPA